MGFIICQVILDFLIFLTVILVIPLALLLLSPLYLWRQTVKFLAKYFRRKELGEMLSDTDAFLLLGDSGKVDLSPEVVISILVTLEGQVDVEQFKTNIYNDIVNARKENGKLVYERLQQRLTSWLGYAFFEWKPDFNINNHVKVFSDVKIIEENKHEFVASRVREPFDRGCGMWEVVLVPYFNGENKTLANLRVHHLICDGSSILKVIMTRAMKINPQEFIFPSKNVNRQVSCGEAFSKFYRNTVGLPGAFMRTNRHLNKVNAFYDPGKLVPSGNILVSTTGKIPLHKFKRAKLRLNIPFTAMVNCAVSGALRAYVKENYDKDHANLANVSGLVFVPLPGHPDDTLVNHCGMGTITISLGDETLKGRLQAANRDFQEALTSSYQTAQRYYIKLVSKLPLPMLRHLVSPDSTSFIYSNMPGPSHPGHLWSNFMSEVMFWNPIFGNHALAFSILSYNEFVKIGVAADFSVISGTDKLKQMTELIQNELERIFHMETL